MSDNNYEVKTLVLNFENINAIKMAHLPQQMKIDKIKELLDFFNWETYVCLPELTSKEVKTINYEGDGVFTEGTTKNFTHHAGYINATKNVSLSDESRMVNEVKLSILRYQGCAASIENDNYKINRQEKPVNFIVNIFMILLFGIPSVLLFCFNQKLMWLAIILAVLAAINLFLLVTYSPRKKGLIKAQEKAKEELPKLIEDKPKLYEECVNILKEYNLNINPDDDFDYYKFNTYSYLLKCLGDNKAMQNANTLKRNIDFYRIDIFNYKMPSNPNVGDEFKCRDIMGELYPNDQKEIDVIKKFPNMSNKELLHFINYLITDGLIVRYKKDDEDWLKLTYKLK